MSSSIEVPKLKRWVLKNGIACVTAHLPDAPLTCIDLWCKGGSSNERTGEEGMAHFLEHMIFKGSNQLKAGEFDLRIEALGGSSNAATGFDDVHFHVLIPPKVFGTALDLLLNLVFKPSIRPEDFLIEREVVLEEIAQSEDQPDELIFQNLLSNCWGEHPYGRPILGLSESLQISSPKMMQAFHHRLYDSQNIALAIAGTIPKNVYEVLSNCYLSKLKLDRGKSQSLKKASKKPFFKKGKKEISIQRLESCRLLMAWPLPPAKDQQSIMGCDIATSIFAEGRSSRFVRRIREELQLVESIDMDITVLEEGGLVILEACCSEKNLFIVEKEINKILKESLNNQLKPEEVERASQLIRNGFCFSLEASSQVASYIGSQVLWNRFNPLMDQLKLVQNWSAEKLKKEVFTQLQPENAFTLIAKPLKENLK